jgi:hypothetical protein
MTTTTTIAVPENLVAHMADTTSPTFHRLRREVFLDAHEEATAFFSTLFREAIIFTVGQVAFHRALEKFGAFAHPSRVITDPAVHYVGVTYERVGQVRYAIGDLVTAFSRLMVEANSTYPSIASVPGRFAHACLFHAGRAPLRAWFFSRFLAADHEDAAVWLSTRFALFQTPEFLDLAYLESVYRTTNPTWLTAEAHAEHRVVSTHDQYATFDTRATLLEHSPRRMIVAFYSYFMQRVMLAACENPLAGFARRADDAQRYFEVALSMLFGWDVKPALPVLAGLPRSTLVLLDDVVEQYRGFVASMATGGGAPLARATYARTVNFDRVYLPNAQVRELIIARGDETRRLVEPFYVPLAERSFSSLMRELFAAHQVAQLHLISRWCAANSVAVDRLVSPDDEMYAADANERFYVATFPGGVHYHRVAWSLRYYEEAARPMLDGLAEAAHVGLDAVNSPFMVLPRDRMDLLRLVMLADSYTAPNFHKTTAVYPLLVRAYLTRQRTPTPRMDEAALHAFAAVLGYWLCVPAAAEQRVFGGGARFNDASSTPALAAVHLLVDILYRARMLRSGAVTSRAISLDMLMMNSVRSYLLVHLPHHMSHELFARLCASLSEADDDGDEAFGALYDALMAIPVGRPMNARRLEKASQRGRPREQERLRIDASRVCTSLINLPEALARLPRDHPARQLTPDARTAYINMGIYEYLFTRAPLTFADEVICDFQALVDPLTERNYRTAHYRCSPEIVQTWQRANTFFFEVDPHRYEHNSLVLRDTVATATTDFTALITFLQALERFVCLADAFPPGSGLYRARDAARKTLAAEEVPLVGALTAIYSDPEMVLHKMPVSTYYCGADGAHRLALYEESMSIVDLIASPEGKNAPSADPNRVVHDVSASPELSSIAIDLATQFDRETREIDVNETGVAHLVFEIITRSQVLQKKQK